MTIISCTGPFLPSTGRSSLPDLSKPSYRRRLGSLQPLGAQIQEERDFGPVMNSRIFVTLFTAVFVTTMGAGFVAPLLPVYAHELGAGGIQIGLIFAAFSLTRTAFVPYFGKLADRKDKKQLLSAGLLAYCLVSLLYVVWSGVWALILLRLAQGFASAMVLPVAQAYVGEMAPPRQEGRIMGIFNVSLYGGLSVGPLLGGLLKDWIHIHASFGAMGILTLTGFVLCRLLLPQESARDGPNEVLHAKASVTYLSLLQSRSVLSLFAFRTCFSMGIGIVWGFLPLLASTKLGLSSSAIGVVVAMNVLVNGILQAPMGYLADRYSKRVLTVVGGMMGAVALFYLEKAPSFTELLLTNVALGVAGGISFPAVMAQGVIEGKKASAMGSLMGLLTFAHSLGMLVGPLLAGMILDVFPFVSIYLVGSGVLILGTAIFWRVW
jgi:MFS transporter, DHA1 family, multidrug resistance protein